jgi:hypothetical protein
VADGRCSAYPDQMTAPVGYRGYTGKPRPLGIQVIIVESVGGSFLERMLSHSLHRYHERDALGRMPSKMDPAEQF